MEGGFYPEAIGREVRELANFVKENASVLQSAEHRELNEKVERLVKSLAVLQNANITLNPRFLRELRDLSTRVAGNKPASKIELKIQKLGKGLFKELFEKKSDASGIDRKNQDLAKGLSEMAELLANPSENELPPELSLVRSYIRMKQYKEAKDLIKGMVNSLVKIVAFMDCPISLEEDMVDVLEVIKEGSIKDSKDLLEAINTYDSHSQNKLILQEKVTVILATKMLASGQHDSKEILDLAKNVRNWPDRKELIVGLAKQGTTHRVLEFIKELPKDECYDFYQTVLSLENEFANKKIYALLKDNVIFIWLNKEMESRSFDPAKVLREIEKLPDSKYKKDLLIILADKGFVSLVVEFIKTLPIEESIGFYHYIRKSAGDFTSEVFYHSLQETVGDFVHGEEDKILEGLSSKKMAYVRDISYANTPSHLENVHDFLKQALLSRGLPSEKPSDDDLRSCISDDVKQMIPDLARNYRYIICGRHVSKDSIRDELEAGGEKDLSIESHRKEIQENLEKLRSDPRLRSNQEFFAKAVEHVSKPGPIEITDDLVIAVCLLEIITQLDQMPDIDLKKMCELTSLLHQACFAGVRGDFVKRGYDFVDTGSILGEISVSSNFTVRSNLTTSLISNYLLLLKLPLYMDPLLEPFLTEEERKNKEAISDYMKEVAKIGKFTLAFTYNLNEGSLDVDTTPVEVNPVYDTWNKEKIIVHLNKTEYASLYEENKALLGDVIPSSLDEGISAAESREAVIDLLQEIAVRRDSAFAEIKKQAELNPRDNEVEQLLLEVTKLYKSANLIVNRLKDVPEEYIPCYLLHIKRKSPEEKRAILTKAIEDFPNYHKLFQNHRKMEIELGFRSQPEKLRKADEVSSSIAEQLAETERKIAKNTLRSN